jgi:hypothetical protein
MIGENRHTHCLSGNAEKDAQSADGQNHPAVIEGYPTRIEWP